jgi:hypothetical protein
MPNRTKPTKRPDVNTDVSEYIWDIKTGRYKRNPDFRRGNTAVRYILWTVVVLILLIAVIWCLSQA